MSAYMVDKNHIDYLVFAARNVDPGSGGRFWWYHGGTRHVLDHVTADGVGEMLLRANALSIAARYPGDPDPRGGEPPYVSEVTLHWDLDPAQILKAVACLDYQCCEHPGWRESSARAFLAALRDHAIPRVRGYEGAVWGAPPGVARVFIGRAM